jgi:hypothetical protein
MHVLDQREGERSEGERRVRVTRYLFISEFICVIKFNPMPRIGYILIWVVMG